MPHIQLKLPSAAKSWCVLLLPLLLLAGGVSGPVRAETTLRVVMHSDVKILDPIWTTVYITRNHGYMIYDTLFAMDADGKIQPQMAESDTVSADGLAHTIRLREGLKWHDGQPVTAEDCVASIRRWAARDAIGQKILALTKDLTALDERTIVFALKEPTSLLTYALGKPSSNVPFMMPKRVAATDPNTQISDFTGSGPFMLKRDEWRPGDRIVYAKFSGYKPRSEPASAFAGGKVAKVDRVEWVAISDQQQALNALQNGEVDIVEQPPHDLLPLIKKDRDLVLIDMPNSAQYALRFNSILPPMDNPKIRAAVWYALNQDDYLATSIGDPAYYHTCKSFYPCDGAMTTTSAMADKLSSNYDKARALLKEAGYSGAPIVLLSATDVSRFANLGPVAKQALERAGFTVEMQSMDWQTVIARRAKREGWHLFHTSWVGADLLDPVMQAFMNASCAKAPPGWPCDAELETLRDKFLHATSLDEQKTIAARAQERAVAISTHVPLGEYLQPMVTRKNVSGVIKAAVPVFWNVANGSDATR